jgi:hypothetical protein
MGLPKMPGGQGMASGAKSSNGGAANRDTRRQFEQWARNPECEANTVSAILGVPMVDVAVKEGLTPTMGQSPFALQRGQRFERQLLRDHAEVLRTELEKAGVLPSEPRAFADLRMRHHGGTCLDLDEARARTLELFRSVATIEIDPEGPTLIAGATICVPGRAMLPEAILVIDAVVIRKTAAYPELVVGEIKTYPDRGGHTDTAALAGARAQSGVYVHGLREVLRENGWSDRISVANKGFLVLTKRGSNRPSVRANEDLRYQAERAARGLERLRTLAGQLAPSGTPPADPVAAVMGATTHYQEACIRFCDRASGCFARDLAAARPSVLGDDVARLIGPMSLDRVRELLHGARPKTHAERGLVDLALPGAGA